MAREISRDASNSVRSAKGGSPDAGALTASVAMATYNGAKYIAEQLESILAQSVLPDEIVITDDGSTDDTMQIVANFVSRAPFPIRAIANSERLGFARNFMKAISLCRSDLIFLCDQDDIWSDRKVERMKRGFSNPNVYLAYHGALVVTGDGTPLYEFYDAERERALLAVRPFHPWYSSYGLTQVFRAELRRFDDLWSRSLNHVHLENEPLSHDQWYYFLAGILGRVDYVDEPLVRYRQHGANVVGASQVAAGATPWRKFKRKFYLDPRQDRLKTAAALSRAAILAEIGGKADSSIALRCAEGAKAYTLLAARLQRRYDTFRAASSWQRAVSLTRMIAGGDYAGYPWGMRKNSLVRDFVAGVIGHTSESN